MKPNILETNKAKILASYNYNFVFDKQTGFFARWGKTKEDDPEMSVFGPEILDIEISEVCSRGCKFCYKSNTSAGRNMSLEVFKQVMANVPKTVTQVAFGIGDIDGNPDLWNIMQHCRDIGVVPNITINGERMTPEYYDKLVELCGAVAVSHYSNQKCFDAIRELNKRGLKQVNIHKLLCEETYEECLKLIDRVRDQEVLKYLNAIVFLTLKPKGRGIKMKPLKDTKKYQDLIKYALEKDVPFGFDSCSAPMFLKAIEDDPNYNTYAQLAEPCESYCFSLYINAEGRAFPCSFLEDCTQKGIDVTKSDMNFSNEVWNSKEAKDFRADLLATTKGDNCLVEGCRQCPAFDIY